MKVCGLTGGVGMGKSAAARFFLERGTKLLDTDEIAHRLVQPGQVALAAIQAAFGGQVIGPAGELNRAALAQIVFADAGARKQLEAVLHPLIREQWTTQIDIWRGEDHLLAMVVIPLLFETQAEPHFDKIICAACSAAAQRKRLLARGWTPEQIRLRNAAQLLVEEKIARSDYVIWTEGTLAVHAHQVDDILARMVPASA